LNLSLEILLKIAYALGIGVLIGLERSLIPTGKSTGNKSQEKENQLAQSKEFDDLLGVRTFSILSLGGFSAALIGSTYPTVARRVDKLHLCLIIDLYFVFIYFYQ